MSKSPIPTFPVASKANESVIVLINGNFNLDDFSKIISDKTVTDEKEIDNNKFTEIKDALEYKVSPNPSNKEVVTFNQTQDVEVFDTLGKLVLTAKNTNSIDTKSFHSGIYFIRTGSGVTRKLVVK